MRWTKGNYKLVFNCIQYKWAVFLIRAGKFEASFSHNYESWSVGVAFDRWKLSKQLTFSFLTLDLVVTWYSTNDKSWKL